MLKVRETVERLGTSALAKQMGVPISTLHQWKQADTIPKRKDSDKDVIHEMKVAAFKAAVRVLERRTKTKKRRVSA